MAIFRLKVLSLAVACALAGAGSNAAAGGFGIGTQSGSGTGNAFAGGAAAAEDPGVAWYNPAGMMALPAGRHFAAAGHFLRPSFKFSNTGSTLAFSCVAPFPACPGGEGGDGGDWALVPNLFFTTDINPQWRFGIAVNAPFGLKTEYDAGWRGQLTALKSEIKSVNINPSVAYKASDSVSIGAGVSVQKLDAELTSFTGAAALGNAILDADDIGYGFNVGLLVQATPGTRFGASYRSSIKYDLEGTATFTGVAGAAFSGNVTAAIRVPESVSLSVFSVVNPRWEMMGDITWTRWSRIQQLDVIRTTASAGGAAGSTLTSLAFRWDDTWRFGLGANYRMSDQTKLRFGVAYDQTPTNDITRTPRLPDQDRTWVAAGVQFRPSKSGTFEFGYAHEFVRDANVNVTVPGVPGALVGRFKNRADIISLQYSHSF
ncbi:MAG: outer membrane protein transport protein [Betaproteobacteria bacterium]|nr:outer membrane protein transport protein [Betaproteobacteria bacterium]